MRDYTDIPDLSELILEESYVLQVVATPGQVSFSMDFVLTDKHPAYSDPKPDEYLCYRKGVLVLSQVTSLEWDKQHSRRPHDATGEVDYGSIDDMRFAEGRYLLEGSVGALAVDASQVAVSLEPRASTDA